MTWEKISGGTRCGGDLLTNSHGYSYVVNRIKSAQFAAIKSTSNPPPVITQLLEYFETQWSVYGRPIRTNNDLEGWHKRLNNMAHHQHKLNLYLLLQILHKEAHNIRLQAILISNGTVIRYQCTKYKKTQAIIKAWKQLQDAKQLLKICSRVNGPVVDL